MDINKELEYFIEDLRSEEIIGLFAVRISKNDKTTITGDNPKEVLTVTCIPPDGFNKSQGDFMRDSIREIGQVLKQVITKETTNN